MDHFWCPVVTLVTGCLFVPNLGTDGHVCPSVPILGTDREISKISKNQFKQQNINKKIIVEKEKKEKCYPLSFPILLGRDSTRALQSNPFQNPGGVGGYRERDARRMEILVYNFGYSMELAPMAI